MKNIFTSIDIGSDSIKIVTCELHNNKLNLLAASSTKSKGIRMGMIVNPNEACLAIKKCLNDVESMLGITINKVIASVPANMAEFTFIKGNVNVNTETGLIESKNIIDVLQIAMEDKVPVDREMVTIIPIDFKINGGEIVSNPLGRQSKTLETRAIMITTPKKNIYSVVTVLESLGVDVIDIMINSIGDINSLKTKETNDKVGAIVNIGSDTTNISLYNKNIVVKNSIINIGGRELDRLISNTYKLDLDTSRKLKEKFALAHRKYANVSEFMEVANIENVDIKINQYDLSEICMKKLQDILLLVKKEIDYLTDKPLEYVIFTGGTSMMAHFDYLVKEEFSHNSSIGNVRIIGVRNNMYSSCVGNIIYFISKLKLKGKDYSMVSQKDQENLSSRKGTSISSDSMLGKVVDYFFGE